MTDPIKHFDSGAIRSSDADATAYSLITPIGLRRVAATYAEGARKYGDANWELGMPVREFIEHAIRHAYLYLEGDRSEDHLGHAAWNFMGACHSEELWPHLNTDLRVEGCKLSEATQAEIKERNAARAAAKLAPPPVVENDGWKVGDKGYWVGSVRGRYDFVVKSIDPADYTSHPNSVRLHFIDTKDAGRMGWMPSHECHHVVENDGWKVGDKGYYDDSFGRTTFRVSEIEPLPSGQYGDQTPTSVRLYWLKDGGYRTWMPSHRCHHES